MKDFFVSYTGRDSIYAVWIAYMLEKMGYSTVIQAWDFKPGDNLVAKINESLIDCDKLVIILSDSYLNSKWCETEWTTKLYENVKTGDRKIIPIRVEPVNISGLLAPLIYIDLVNKTKDEAYKELENGIKRDICREPDEPFPIGYSVRYIEINNKYFIFDSKIIMIKRCKTKIYHDNNKKIHNRITWFADETVDITSMTPNVNVEILDIQDSNINFNVVFNESFIAGDTVEYEICIFLSNIKKHFKDFVSTEVIVPVNNITVSVIFMDKKINHIYTQILTDSLMNLNNKEEIKHNYDKVFIWNVNNPQLHYEYKVFW